jgi:hypothetical protein
MVNGERRMVNCEWCGSSNWDEFKELLSNNWCGRMIAIVDDTRMRFRFA